MKITIAERVWDRFRFHCPYGGSATFDRTKKSGACDCKHELYMPLKWVKEYPCECVRYKYWKKHTRRNTFKTCPELREIHK